MSCSQKFALKNFTNFVYSISLQDTVEHLIFETEILLFVSDTILPQFYVKLGL